VPTVSNETLDALYKALEELHLTPADILSELRREGKKLDRLAHLTEWDARRLLKETEKHRSAS
jgi:hypothetical protein